MRNQPSSLKQLQQNRYRASRCRPAWRTSDTIFTRENFIPKCPVSDRQEQRIVCTLLLIDLPSFRVRDSSSTIHRSSKFTRALRTGHREFQMYVNVNAMPVIGAPDRS